MTRTEHQYFLWLISQIHIPNNKLYNHLFGEMYNTEFVWFIPNDDNRLADGMHLREEFMDGTPLDFEIQGISFLEVLVALSRRSAFTGGGHSEQWAWKLLKHLGLTKMSDPLSRAQLDQVKDILYSVVWRTYHPTGRGGFFPLKYPKEDQTKLEIWAQMNAYIIEKDPSL